MHALLLICPQTEQGVCDFDTVDMVIYERYLITSQQTHTGAPYFLYIRWVE
jgi:hypothetical protein